MNHALREEVTAQIRCAFDGVARGAITLHEARVIDFYGTDEERQEARAQDTEACWQQVPATAIEAHWQIFPFLCPESFRYYLPAYLCFALHQPDSLAAEFTLYALDCDHAPPPQSYSEAQRQAIWAFLALERDCRSVGDVFLDDIERAERRWHTPA